MVPSAVHMLEQKDWASRIGRWPWVERVAFLGKQALIGREALERNQSEIHPAFCETFKAQLGQAPTFPLVRVGGRTHSAREVARTFLRELFAASDRAGGGRIRDLTLTVPVDSYEGYRFMNVARWFMDAADPQGVADHLLDGNREVLLQMATLDFIIPNEFTEKLEALSGAPRKDYIAEHAFLAVPVEPEYLHGVTDMANFIEGGQ